VRIAILLPPPGKPSCVDNPHWEASIRALSKGLARKGFDVGLFPHDDRAGTARQGNGDYYRTARFFGLSREFDVVQGYFDPFFAVCAAMGTARAVLSLEGKVARRSVSILNRYGDRVFYVTPSEACIVEGLGAAGAVGPGLDMDRYAYHAEPEDYLLAFASTVGPGEMARARQLVKETGRRLLIAGDRKEATRLSRVMASLGGDAVLEFVPVSGFEEQVKLAGGARALVRLGPKNPVGLCLAGAMACGTPLLDLSADNPSGFVIPGVTGIGTPGRASLKELLRRVEGLDRRLCREAAAEQFDMDRMIEGYATIYEALEGGAEREDRRPWGYYDVLVDEERCKVKRILVFPGGRLSLQRHLHRAEHWYVVSGEGIATCGEKELFLTTGDSVDIPREAVHRIQNRGAGDLIFVEVQSGDYCGEDDIERFEDDYGRI
jgi:mannose-6-phosphate isomerase-like protein (cupin superfamily)